MTIHVPMTVSVSMFIQGKQKRPRQNISELRGRLFEDRAENPRTCLPVANEDRIVEPGDAAATAVVMDRSNRHAAIQPFQSRPRILLPRQAQSQPDRHYR